MTEQWFLDLDGVRSGPYQKSEVMSLVAEGEVLPHHRISTGLKEEKWVTVLDWRLDQANFTETSSYSKIEVIPITEIPTEIIPAPAPEVIQAPIAKPPPHPAASPAAAPAAPPVQTSDRPRRDPMTEMFDMLQTTKQKREAKQSKQAHAEATVPVVSEKTKVIATKKSGHGKSILLGLGIILVGFALGQMFQESNSPKETAKTQLIPSPTIPPTPEATQFKTEVVDRSTEKMSIRGTVERQMNAAEVHKEINPTLSPEKKLNQREMEELKDLKKELQELKALKENLKGDPYDDAVDPSEPNVDNSGNPNNPNNPNNNQPAYPNKN